MRRIPRRTPHGDLADEGVSDAGKAFSDPTAEKLPGEKLQKVLARAGLGSRRLMEEWIAAGRISVNGEPATLGMRVEKGDLVKVDRRTIHISERSQPTRLLIYHKPEGEIVSRDDPEDRASVFDKLPKVRGQKWVAIGRLDINTSGLLIFTTSGDLANRLMHPRFEVEREYAVRLQGMLTEAQMAQMIRKGIELEDGLVRFEEVEDQGGEGFNHWYRVILKEGRNRIVRRAFDALGLPVSRLMRIRFGIISLPSRLKRGMVAELGEGEVAQVLEWAGISAASEGTGQASPTLHPAGQVRSSRQKNRPVVAKASIRRASPVGGKKSKTGVKR